MNVSAPFTLLFLSTGNSTRSVLAEAILNKDGKGRFQAFSAGSFPKGTVHPQALHVLETLGHPVEDLRSKSWDEFAGPEAAPLDFVITLCDNAADEVCPVWPGQPVTAHWSVPDPALAQGSEAEVGLAFSETYKLLSRRIALLLNLPFEALNKQSLLEHVTDLGQHAGASEPVGA
jgi:arsenate reductase